MYVQTAPSPYSHAAFPFVHISVCYCFVLGNHSAIAAWTICHRNTSCTFCWMNYESLSVKKLCHIATSITFARWQSSLNIITLLLC